MLESNLKKAWEKRKEYVEKEDLQAFRLITKEENGWGQGEGLSVAVDLYGYGTKKTAAVIQQYDADMEGQSGWDLEDLLKKNWKVEQVFYKKRFRVKDAPDAGGNLAEQPYEMTVKENGHSFLVNLNNYLDTGLFLDHREARLWTEKLVAEKSANRDDYSVLNLFAYTGSFSVYAAKGGAIRTHTVDLSKTYCDWARRNFDLNGMTKEQHWIYRMDTFEFYKYAARKGLQFDLIILDPPTFSRNKGQNFSVQRDHFALVDGAAKLLKNNGEIMFSNNCLDFVLDRKITQEYKVKDIQNKTVPLDFRVDPKLAGWDYAPQIHNSYLISK